MGLQRAVSTVPANLSWQIFWMRVGGDRLESKVRSQAILQNAYAKILGEVARLESFPTLMVFWTLGSTEYI